MRLTTSTLSLAAALCGLSVLADARAAPAGGRSPDASPSEPSTAVPPAAPAEAADKPKDLLGNMVVVAAATRSLPKIGVVPSLSPDLEDVTLRSVIRRDLDLAGEFELLSDDDAPDSLYLSDSPVDTKAWARKGAEAVVRVSAHKTSDKADTVELVGQAFLVKSGQTPVFEKKTTVLAAALRTGSHRLADALIGALTGTSGGFASRLTFASGSGKVRRAYVIDADGFGARGVSPDAETAIAPAFGKGEELFWAASKNNGEYRLRSESGKDHPLPVSGSVYGVAFSKDRNKVTVTIGTLGFIKLYSGPDLAHLSIGSTAPFAMEPTFTPGGKVAFVGLGQSGQRVFVDDKPVTPDGVFAMSPTFCNHPDGVKLVFAAGPSTDTDLFSTGEQGGAIARLTQDQGKNSSPACSPDGRMIAFFSTRKTGEGPGLYVMRADGLRPKRISPLAGDSLRWDPLPPDSPVASPAPASAQ